MSLEKSQKILKAMWDKVAKPSADGKRQIVIKNQKDLEYHYWTGFVDDEIFSLQDWVEAFKDSLLPNGMYLINEAQWLDKAKYHYSGPIHPPYDPMTIREGEWSEEELHELVWEKIKPNVYFSKEDFEKIIAESRKSIPKTSEGKFLISPELKKDWTEFINTYASPRRMLQIGVYQLKAAKQGSAPSGTPSGSGFSQGPGASRQIADQLSHIIGKR